MTATKIITRNTDSVVIYAGDNITLTAEGATSQGGSFDPTTTTANAALIEGVTLPTPWTGGAYSYADDEWVVVGQGLLDALQPSAAVPQSVTMRQARLALLDAGLLDDVDTAIAAIPDPVERRKAEVTWEFSSEVERTQPFVLMLAPALGLNDAALDALFIDAKGR